MGTQRQGFTPLIRLIYWLFDSLVLEEGFGKKLGWKRRNEP